MELDQQIAPDAGAEVIDQIDEGQSQPRDYDAEARRHGWTPKEEFRGDPAKWVDAETFAKRADEVMPFLKKKTEAQDREIADLKRTIKQAAKFYEGATERAYKQGMADLEARHTDAVESGDVAGAKRAIAEMRELEKDVQANAPTPEIVDDAAERKKIMDWVEVTSWYGPDEQRTKYADMQADAMGGALAFPGGVEAWLAELERRVDRKFADKKPSPVGGGGNRPAPSGGGKTYNDLPAAAKATCDRWVKNGMIASREAYVKDYDFGD